MLPPGPCSAPPRRPSKRGWLKSTSMPPPLSKPPGPRMEPRGSRSRCPMDVGGTPAGAAPGCRGSTRGDGRAGPPVSGARGSGWGLGRSGRPPGGGATGLASQIRDRGDKGRIE